MGHLFGAIFNFNLFYRIATTYWIFSQLTIVNDIYTLKTSHRLIQIDFRVINDIYTKILTLGILAVITKSGFNKFKDYARSKDIVIRK